MPKPRKAKTPKAQPMAKGTIRVLETETIDRYDATDYDWTASKTTKAALADFLALYAAHPWVYAAVHAIATAAASVRFRILKNGAEVKDDKTLAIFNQPNPYMTWFEFMEATFCYTELTGNCFWEEVYDKDENLIALLPLRPDKMRITPHPKRKIANYRYKPSSKGDEILFDPEEITHIKYFNPANEYWGVGPAAAAENGIIQDFWAVAYNKGYFKRGAEPGFVLETDNSLTDMAFSRLLESWKKRHQGVDKTHVPAILEEGLKYKPIGISQKDMQFLELRKMSREEVLGVFRVPPILVGIMEAASYATAREQKKSFWMDNVLVKLQRLEGIINQSLMPSELEFKFVTESITSIIEDEQVAANIANQYVTHGIMTINEVRKKYLNLDPVKWGDVYWVPVGLAPVSGPAAPVSPGGPAPVPGSNNNPNPQTTDGEQTGTKGPAFVPSPPPTGPSIGTPTGVEEKRLQKKRQWTDTRREIHKKLYEPDIAAFEKELLAFLKAQGQRVLGKVNASDWPVKGMAKADDEGDEPVPKKTQHWLLDLSSEAAVLRKILASTAEKLFQKYGQALYKELGLTADFNMKDPFVEKWLSKYAADKVSQINETTRGKIHDRIVAAVKDREDFETIKRAIGEAFEGPIAESRARLIARTEVVTLTNNAKLQAAKQSGVVEKKVWISELLESTRDPHREMDGTTIGLDKKFTVKNRSGADQMDGPGDPDAAPENVCNCLCVLDFPPSTGEYADLFEEKRDAAPAPGLPPVPISKTTRLIRDPETNAILGSRVDYEYKGDDHGRDDQVPPGAPAGPRAPAGSV